MNITISEESGGVPVHVLKIDGQLDGQTFEVLIREAREVHESGARNLLLDLTDLTYISSAGLVALHTIALMMRGEAAPDVGQSWSALKSMEQTRGSGIQKHLKLLRPRAEVLNVLEMVGFKEFFEIFESLETAVKSF